MMNKTKKGFTLIELLIVITIIGILAAALLPNILAAPTRARDAARKADINSIVAGIEALNADGTVYPSGVNCINDTNFPGLAAYVGGGVIPTDPNNQVVTFESNPACAAGEYFYCEVTATNQNYAVAALMEDSAQGNDDGLVATPVCGAGGSSNLTAGGFHVVVQ